MDNEQVSFLQALCLEQTTTHSHFDQWLVPALRQVDYGEIAFVIVKMHELINERSGEVAEAEAEQDTLRAEVARWKDDYDKAAQLVAEMHAAAVGEVRGPIRGVVEDIEGLRAEVARLTAELSGKTGELEAAKKRIADLVRLEAQTINTTKLVGDYEKLQAELQQAREWIAVRERLPDVKDVVLIAIKNRTQACEGYLTEKNEWRVWGGVYPYFTAATHWRPLPTPPEQEANG